MDKFTITIELGNEAMQDGRDVADALRRVAGALERAPLVQADSGGIWDRNGNRVGTWEVSE